MKYYFDIGTPSRFVCRVLTLACFLGGSNITLAD